MMKIIKNKTFLGRKTLPCNSVSEGEVIGKKLIAALEKFGGFGISANQLGINRSVCVVKVRENEEPKILINPTILEKSDDMLVYMEGCLSIPGRTVKTLRSKTIKVSCDNWVNEIEFGPDNSNLNKDNFWEDVGLRECICIQHEVDHLNGKLITDSNVRFKEEPLRVSKTGRNERVMLKKGDETLYVKYKKTEKYLSDGWIII